MTRVLIAGIGGASLGTELAKTLRHAATRYELYGCDKSNLAFGHYSNLFADTSCVREGDYVEQIIGLCQKYSIEVLLPGGDEPARLIGERADIFRQIGIIVAGNAPLVVSRLSDKERCFEELERRGFRVPRTVAVSNAMDWATVPCPCVVKPSTGSGGSAWVFFARDQGEARIYSQYLLANGNRPICQEYIDHRFGEFTVGVVSSTAGEPLSTVAMKRSFPAKLSVHTRGRDFLISSGFSQGQIAQFPDVEAVCRRIAVEVGSVGPLNIQGRVDAHGTFLPFEINPRFSASVYLRALAGTNEVDLYLSSLLGQPIPPTTIRAGWYLRSLTEVAVDETEVRP